MSVTGSAATSFYVGIVKAYSSMTVGFNATSNGSTSNETLTYGTGASSGNLRRIDFAYTIVQASGTSNYTSVGWVDVSSGTVVNFTVTFGSFSQSYVGSQAEGLFDSTMVIFGLQQTYGTAYYALLTDPAYFHSAGTATATFGPTSFQVTTYVANTLPETVTGCGSSFTFTDYEMQIGTPSGSASLFVTRLHISGSTSSGGMTTDEDFTYALISMTQA